ncbi:hypothetical protein C6P61_01135 [Malikia spinosa]|uniref:Uncharacterized protein n=1 Tax=Malikia spinosa TaxID=86180 RepID=A0A2S9KIR5_9BURK|nr:hypothetical protein C6P61_01135 [Malikia spinosa]
MACSRVSPHISWLGGSEPQTAGRSGWPNRRQRSSASRWGQGRPAGLPLGSPGMGLLIEGAMQQAAQPGRQESDMLFIQPGVRHAAAGGRPCRVR